MCPSPVNIDPSNRQHEAALQFLNGRINYERVPVAPYQARELKLERMRQLMARLGDAQRQLPIVHVAGTKGKGSTAAMIGAVLSAAGYRTGTFTSPHLDRIEERIAVDGQPCSPDELTGLVRLVAPVVEAMDGAAGAGDWAEIGPTYFEIITAMALLHFARRGVDAAVLEVGLGGRLDATNICRAQVSAITSIGLDHTVQLGNTLQSIAREKAGIVKPGVPVVSGVTESGPRDVIRQICRERGAVLRELGVDFDFQYDPPRRLQLGPARGQLAFRGRGARRRSNYTGLSLGLLGRHQAANAAVALAVLGELQEMGWQIPEDAIRAGLAGAVCPARVELLAQRPAIVLDSAHNLSSVNALVRSLKESFSVRRRLLVFGATKGKDVRGMVGRLLEQFDEAVFTQYLSNPRAVPAEELAAVAAELTGARHRVCLDPASAWGEVRSLAAADDLICVTGSFFIAAEMRRHIGARPSRPSGERVGCESS
jgi:dihydrofolate synthase/folylpolyglutamate synthase